LLRFVAGLVACRTDRFKPMKLSNSILNLSEVVCADREELFFIARLPGESKN
jgi:hypothetical protein